MFEHIQTRSDDQKKTSETLPRRYLGWVSSLECALLLCSFYCRDEIQIFYNQWAFKTFLYSHGACMWFPWLTIMGHCKKAKQKAYNIFTSLLSYNIGVPLLQNVHGFREIRGSVEEDGEILFASQLPSPLLISHTFVCIRKS